MRWVERGPRPDGLQAIQRQYTPKWVAFYPERRGDEPTDTQWQKFSDDLEIRFSGACGYCEEYCSGEVDHFKPKSKYPGLVYEWSNWVFACRPCNSNKGNKWPSRGYVNPCARSRPARPEFFFDFNLCNGKIRPNPGLSPLRKKKAQDTINDLGLYKFTHLRKRRQRIVQVKTYLDVLELLEDPVVAQAAAQTYCSIDAPTIRRRIEQLADPASELSSITKAVLDQRGYQID